MVKKSDELREKARTAARKWKGKSRASEAGQFLRSLPPDTSTDDAIRLAAEAGFTLTRQQACTMLSWARRMALRQAKALKKQNGFHEPASAVGHAVSDTTNSEQQFVDLVFDIGFVRARDLMLKAEAARHRLKQAQ